MQHLTGVIFLLLSFVKSNVYFFLFFTKCLKKVLTHLFLMYIMGASGVEVVPKWRKVLKNYGNVWRIYA
mgnify:CR=1 FL=1|jgi:hypothetical protein